ncbi:hypothetical protein G6F68_016341 [Rhizopus microsporus]|nr:hypothetical protein G6F68_016341 [Rhizopus microsporus]
MHGGDLLHNYVVADVVHRQRGQVQVAADLDRGTEVVHLLRTTNHSQPVQCAADGGIAVAEDQALAAVGQCANAQVQALACGDGAGPSHTTDVGRQVVESAGLDGDAVAVDAAAADVVDVAGRDMGDVAVQQPVVDQCTAGIQTRQPDAADLAGGRIDCPARTG